MIYLEDKNSFKCSQNGGCKHTVESVYPRDGLVWSLHRGDNFMKSRQNGMLNFIVVSKWSL